MKSIHPFPARMASELADDFLSELPSGSKVLDPMCGSGTVVRSAVEYGHNAIGTDMDPLAVLMSQVGTSKQRLSDGLEGLDDFIASAHKRTQNRKKLAPWIEACDETKAFVQYWFGNRQAIALTALAMAIQDLQGPTAPYVKKLYSLAMSRLVITKKAGASLAWDVSHSRPHRKKSAEENDFDVLGQFKKSVNRIINGTKSAKPGSAKVYSADARDLSRISDHTIDAIVTSPPYLNAIDYMRGHKFSLIWQGYTIPELRNVRSTSVGAERKLDKESQTSEFCEDILEHQTELSSLPKQNKRIIGRYLHDLWAFQTEFRRVLKTNGQLMVVLGDCYVNGKHVRNSMFFKSIAEELGFALEKEFIRDIPMNRRYLPMTSNNGELEKRMRQETVQVYSS